MERILVATDFSAASRHALDFTANLVRGRDVQIDLIHPYPVSVIVTADALALASLGAGIGRAEQLLAAELTHIEETWPELRISGRVIGGSFIETLREESAIIGAKIIVLGTTGFGELYLGDTDPLQALRMLRTPVLFIPVGAAIRPISNIAYACNLKYAGADRTPVAAISDLASWCGAKLEVVHTDKQDGVDDPRRLEGERWLRRALAPLEPVFHRIVDPDLLHGLGSHLLHGNADCLMVVPRRYGFWENLLHQSRTKALARMNRFPVIAIQELPGT